MAHLLNLKINTESSFFGLSMAHLLNLRINTESSFFGLSMVHLLNLSSVLSTFLPYLSSIGGSAIPWWSPIHPECGGSQWGGGLPRGILFQGFPKVWTESAKTIHPLPMVESDPSRLWGKDYPPSSYGGVLSIPSAGRLPRGPCSGAICRGPDPAGPGVPKGVDGVGEEGMTWRQRSVDQQASQDLHPGSPAKFWSGSPAKFWLGSPARVCVHVLLLGSPARFCSHVPLLDSPARFCPGSPARFSHQVLVRFSCQFL
uniref:Uncharacterized protein n=1 Tax=Myotis myotis TaxID=51298 RepID=A0A7J7UPG4_MYOMY|nr:hypothetical protein mMyoMyo1_008571 [Myotis myotis]